ncbi:MAG: cobalamin-dependent protein [Candidatus Lokiarchaeota archaeon]|nr:cobalamin-dependent protein [Candidatus Lokiarchaeota archaeon]
MSLKEQLQTAVLDFDENKVKSICKTSLDNKQATAVELLRMIGDVMKQVGDRFEKEEIFLPELIAAANTVKVTIDELLDPIIRESGVKKETKGVVVLGTVEGDIHSIGKDLVGSFLFANGFEVHNLGVDVAPEMFLEKAEEFGATIIGMSALLSISMDIQRKFIELLKREGKRDKFKVVVGGAPTSEDWAKNIGADGWADDAIGAVKLCLGLVS